MSEQTLPAVAKSIFVECKKCAAERYHTVIAHTTPTSAKVKCEICGSSKTYKLSTPKAVKAAKPGAKKRTPRTVKPTASTLFDQMNQEKGHLPTVGYTMKSKFENAQKIQHPKFGVGYIQAVFADRIEVLFAEEIKTLIHNRV